MATKKKPVRKKVSQNKRTAGVTTTQTATPNYEAAGRHLEAAIVSFLAAVREVSPPTPPTSTTHQVFWTDRGDVRRAL